MTDRSENIYKAYVLSLKLYCSCFISFSLLGSNSERNYAFGGHYTMAYATEKV